MRAYRICEECGAALDPGERCDCQPAPPLKLIRPGSAQAGAYPRHKRLVNEDFTGAPSGFALTFSEESRGRREDHAAVKGDQNQPL